VIEGATEIKVLFAKFDKDSKPISGFKEYGQADIVPARVLKADSNRDLVVLELDSVPAHTEPITMASKSPEPGEEVHTVGGSPKESIGLWIYSKGNVREVQEDHLMLDGKQKVDAWVIRTSNPINPEDSGGGLVNKNCELVGVCSASKTKADLVRVFIDIREVKTLLNTLPSTPGVTPSKEVPKTPPPALSIRTSSMAAGYFQAAEHSNPCATADSLSWTMERVSTAGSL
jgi:S1-C subfamily serine protease